MAEYGYVWQPDDINNEWSPYSDGRWVYTDAGWTWYSNEPYGWAVFHYGRWLDVRGIGWVWIPGNEWGPGWVAWRRSPNYVGWAPLPPEARFTVGIGFSGWVDRYYDIGPAHYRFVEMENLGAPRLNTVFVDRLQNITIINETTNITNITYRGDTIYNGGPNYEELVRVSREPIPKYKLERRREISREGGTVDDRELRSRVEENALRVVDLPVAESREGRPEEVAKTISDPNIERGWRDVGSPEEIAALREKIENNTELPKELPEKPDPSRRARPDRPESAAAPGLPPAPRSPVSRKGAKEMTPGSSDLPPEPGATNPNDGRPEKGKGKSDERGNDRPERRPESKGTMKDPAQPGTETRPRPPAPGEPQSGRPPVTPNGTKGMTPGTSNRANPAPEPGDASSNERRPERGKGRPAERPTEPGERRPESKGTMKDPAQPGTETRSESEGPSSVPSAPRPQTTSPNDRRSEKGQGKSREPRGDAPRREAPRGEAPRDRRRESKGAMKSPAQPGTENRRERGTPEAAAPPRPLAPREGKRPGAPSPPREDDNGKDKGRDR